MLNTHAYTIKGKQNDLTNYSCNYTIITSENNTKPMPNINYCEISEQLRNSNPIYKRNLLLLFLARLHLTTQTSYLLNWHQESFFFLKRDLIFRVTFTYKTFPGYFECNDISGKLTSKDFIFMGAGGYLKKK